jgi:hypothetical protein
MVTLHDMLKDSSANTPAGRAPASPPQQQQGVNVDLRGRYSKIAMPAVAAAARYHSGSDAHAADTPAGKSWGKSPQRS